MGRPRASGAAASSEAAREDLLAAAAELFTSAGYAATTTRAIAQRAAETGRSGRAALKATYHRLVEEVLVESSPATGSTDLDVLTNLMFAMIEGVITARKESADLDVDSYAHGGADAALRILGVTPSEPTAELARALLAALE